MIGDTTTDETMTVETDTMTDVITAVAVAAAVVVIDTMIEVHLLLTGEWTSHFIGQCRQKL
jgi:hypothetical protein